MTVGQEKVIFTYLAVYYRRRKLKVKSFNQIVNGENQGDGIISRMAEGCSVTTDG